MTLKNRYYPESKFGGFSDIDGTVCFYARVNSLLKPDFTILDVGCGRGEYQDDTCDYRRRLRIMKGKCQKVIGIDVDENAKDNPYLDEFHLIEGDHWPYLHDNSIDLIICDYVLEHIEFPERLFNEFKRVLKVGGILCCRTPNLYSYFGIASNFIPDKLHSRIVTKIQDTRKSEDVFPKFYRSNSLFKIRKLLRHYDFTGVVYGFESEPAYFTFSKILYSIAKFIHSITPGYFKTQVFIFARKTR